MENITYENIISLVKTFGSDNVEFLLKVNPLNNIMGIKYTSSSDPTYIVPYTINVNDDARYNWLENYKFELRPTEEGFPIERYYTSDLVGSIRSGFIQMRINPKDNLNFLLNGE